MGLVVQAMETVITNACEVYRRPVSPWYVCCGSLTESLGSFVAPHRVTVAGGKDKFQERPAPRSITIVFDDEAAVHFSVAMAALGNDTYHRSLADTDMEFMTESPVADAALRAGFALSSQRQVND